MSGLPRAALGFLLGLLARAWLATLRVRVVADPALARYADRPWVLSFFHGTQFPLLAWRRRRRTVALVSLSKDGTMQARALALQGLDVVRGSSSRGGVRGLAALVRVLKRGEADAAFAVDGPRGPRGVAKAGAALAARAAGGVLVPLGSACSRPHVLRRTWDSFTLAWPFSRVVVVLGAPLDPASPRVTERLSSAISLVNDAAAREVLAPVAMPMPS